MTSNRIVPAYEAPSSKELSFLYPFSAFSTLNFVNCFASVYLYLEGYEEEDDYDCSSREGGNCIGCEHCEDSAASKQEALFFLFGTMSGDTALREGYSERIPLQDEICDTDEQIEFIMKFVGYAYRKVTDNFKDAIIRSIHTDKPVLVRMKDSDRGSFRVITGYDETGLICPKAADAQKEPDCAPTYEEIDCLYVMGEKGKPVYRLLDGLKRIERVMAFNQEARLWDGYIERFDYWNEKLGGLELEQLRERFQRVSDTMWVTFNTHNFAETFRQSMWPGMQNERLAPAFDRISLAYDLTHTRAWQLISLHGCRDWSKRRDEELEWGMCATAMMILESIRDNDEQVFAAIQEAISILER
ncbi:hypothetical protein [Gorillibacterium sp. CAU 1737]|uniref:hypothetical protein n=1 Tax=Gorillibacterium sp. CAU 1737 TaxID=3140362 RepID=UPI003261D4B8